jgi:hypothetical protein
MSEVGNKIKQVFAGITNFLILCTLMLCLMTCGKRIKIVKEEPVRQIISFSVNLSSTEKGYKPLTLYCDSVSYSINYKNITYARYGNEEALINNMYDEINDTIPIVFNVNKGNVKFNDKLCLTYPFYEKNEKKRGWYNLIVCDSIPTSLTYSQNDKEVKYNVISYTISKKAPTWNDNYPEMMYYSETDEYLKMEVDDQNFDTNVDGLNEKEVSEIPQSIIKEVPNGFSILHISYGDLNGDKINDAVIALENVTDLNTKLQILFGQKDKNFLQHKMLDVPINVRSCRETYIKIDNGTLEITNAKWECGPHGSHYTYTDVFEYSPSDKQIFITENYLLYQNVLYSENAENNVDEEIEDHTKYVAKITIEDYHKSKQ